LGLGYGDEGKGLATDYFCRTSVKPLVIRFNGGHQAGHTVTTIDGLSHVCSNFGSGTLRGVPTYWSSYCTFSPAYFLDEFRQLPVNPLIYIDNQCPVTTHYDVLYNRAIETSRGKNRHGSCGVGFGATVIRHNYDSLKLKVEDIFKPEIHKRKLSNIREYYKKKINAETVFEFEAFDHDREDVLALGYVDKLLELIAEKTITIVNEKQMFKNESWQTFIFEGAQGILLDIESGVYPYVTKSNTTSKNALEMLRRNFSPSIRKEICYVTRAYLTRHGAGPFDYNESDLLLANAATETNTYNPYQGEFKTGYLSLDLLNKSLKIDEQYVNDLNKSLIITCLDQVDSNNLPILSGNKLITINYKELVRLLNGKFLNCIYSFSSCSENIHGDISQWKNDEIC